MASVERDSSYSGRYALYLFVAGATARSADAIRNVRKIYDLYLRGRADLRVVDIYQQPELARREQIVAVPTLLKKHPVPVKRFIGDLADTKRILLNLD